VPSLGPEQSIGFLLADVSRLLRRDFDRRVRALALTQAQWRAIAHLAREEGIKQAVLADRLEVKPITLARLIDRMEAAGWVTRRPDPDDRRAALLYLTDKVQPILDEMLAHGDAAVSDLMIGVSRSSRDELVSALLRMKQTLAEADAAADPRSIGRITENVAEREESKRRRAR
jgi:DNA-binding MarR family transcriptional regulator